MNARQLALSILEDIEERERYTHLALPAALSESKLDARDRGLVSELVRGVLRYRLALDFLIDNFSSRPTVKIEAGLLDLLRLGLYQLIYLDRIPDHAAVNTSVDMAKENFNPGAAKFVNAILRQAIRKRDHLPWPDRNERLSQFLSVYYSHPQWLVDLYLEELGLEVTEKVLEADNVRPKVTLRTNTLKVTRSELLETLKQEEVPAYIDTLFPDAVVLDSENIPVKVITDGLGYAQNRSSIAVGHAIGPLSGQTVIDLCAAPGGKTTHLAQLMKNKGEIFAVDVHPGRLKLVEDNCRRLGIDIVKFISGDASGPLKLPDADHVLLDAPCSGLGVLARRPDIRWQKTPEDIPRLAELQIKLLSQAAKHVIKDGLLTYSVCTMTRAETVGVVDKFLADNPHFKPVPVTILEQKFKDEPYARFWPQSKDSDGMFIAQFVREK